MVTFKKLRIFITAIVFLVALGVLGGFSSSTLAATVGQQLLKPEEGWKRYDIDSNNVFSFEEKWTFFENNKPAYDGPRYLTV